MNYFINKYDLLIEKILIRIKSTGTNNFYLKDRPGSIRAILNESNYLVQALDYDAWGYLARSWDTTATRYKFTGKERDNESTYDYFRARYYNSRTAVWLSSDPLFEKHIQFTPYNYVLGNPMIMIDPDGRQIKLSSTESIRKYQVEMLKYTVPKRYGDYFKIIQDKSGNYILDCESLKSATNDNNSKNFNKLLNLAGQNEYINLNFVNEEFKIEYKYFDKNGDKANADPVILNSKTKKGYIVGFSTYSGNIQNYDSEMPFADNNESNAYILDVLLGEYNEEEIVKTLSHELYFHIYNYYNFETFLHKNSENNEEIKENDIETINNYKER